MLLGISPKLILFLGKLSSWDVLPSKPPEPFRQVKGKATSVKQGNLLFYMQVSLWDALGHFPQPWPGSAAALVFSPRSGALARDQRLLQRVRRLGRRGPDIFWVWKGWRPVGCVFWVHVIQVKREPQIPKSSFTMRAWQLVLLAPIGSSSSLHSAACSASGASHGVTHSIVS